MIELLLDAERALTHGRVDHAEKLYQQVAAGDPKSSIALVGLARVALERADDRTAYLYGRRAMAVDPENPAARHLVMRMAEVLERRGEAVPTDLEVVVGPLAMAAEAAAAKPAAPSPPRRRGLIGRLLGRRRGG